MEKEFGTHLSQLQKKKREKKKQFMFLLKDSILVIWIQEALVDSWADECLMQFNFAWFIKWGFS
jgi:hypothetical protein